MILSYIKPHLTILEILEKLNGSVATLRELINVLRQKTKIGELLNKFLLLSRISPHKPISAAPAT